MIKIDSLKITQEILGLISEIDEFKGAWRALGTIAPERLIALRKVASIESIGSSTRIEGSKLTDREIEKLLSNLEIKSFKSRDEQEVAGYSEVMELIFQSHSEVPITENHIKQIHGNLLKYSTKDSRHRGSYKTLSNNVVAFDEAGKEIGIVFQTATPFDTPRLMKELIDWTTDCLENKVTHPLIAIAIFTVVFLEIHPFQDGNGRLSRILTNLLLLKAGYAYTPYCSLESVIEENKEGYYFALRQTQGTIRTESPDWEPWLKFFLRVAQKQVKKLMVKIEKEKILLSALPELSLKILDHAKAHGRVTMGDLIKLTGISRNTLKEHLRVLQKKGFLEMQGQGRSSWYNIK